MIIPFLVRDLLPLGDLMDVPYHIKTPDSDLRSGTLEAGNEKRGKTENIKENDGKINKTNFL